VPGSGTANTPGLNANAPPDVAEKKESINPLI
jgi:hypothetical protein